MFLKKTAYWGAGFICAIVMIVVGYFVGNNFSFYGNPNLRFASDVRHNLQMIYVSCSEYWKNTNPANTCDVDIASQTTYGYFQSPHVVIWGEAGNQYDFNLKGKSRKADGIYSLEIKTIKADSKEDQWAMDIRRLENEELESALIEMNEQLGPNKTP